MAHHIVTLPGDGIGPEIMAPTLALLTTLGDFEFEEHLFGGASIDAHGVALIDEVLEACERADAVLLAAVGGHDRPQQAATGAGPLGAAQGARPVREPAPGQAAAGAV
jgi:3-isopropylmalate dehydrogenase